ncbi:MAG: 3-hydroxyacyl-ACP dehydratase FabZ [Rhizobiales bacterium]|nr:3-hydroxyacyl-ACP dehydratase FabZ [Hyphomicrobiales bacterium]MBO6698159.1 3-hydroxyacyl-ACP dehydratase FabZ [Hyphomicrobiales bacterium]MBO6735587.1 3-hydroxyacyl-ACP dehydratase FabZ [Hyphomicrobiales bacterium]MBO6910605.1 3-hydroxyacyl-ACP dehydratase FabZ [Hyphomicrobiales bacterium]MBO6956717.1 3-hydroxyacyl-ACP dehydratase FabZ [Hyphomicrobiales bacterium]
MTETPTVLNSVDIQQLLEFLPHRYPFLLVDKIVDMDGDNYGVGIKNVTMNEPHFQGHFPGHPIMPGVLIIEGIAQTAGALCIAASPKRPIQPLVYFMTIDNAKFRKPVIPGDVLHYEVTKVRQRANIWKFAAVAKVDGAKAAEAEISAMIVHPEATA